MIPPMATEGQSMAHPPERDSVQSIFSMPVPHFPQEIIIEILSWLPVKSLGQLQCVCKSWFSLISSSNFIKNHQKYSSRHPKHALTKLVLQASEDNPDILSTFSLHSLLNGISSIEVVEQLVLDSTIKEDPYDIVGSCNGLVCLSSIPGVLTLWNPCTKKSRTLPYDYHEVEILYTGTNISDRVRAATDRSYCATHAFGYDDSNNDYKVVKLYSTLTYSFPKVEEQYVYALGVYSWKSDSWKLIDDVPDGFSSWDSNALVNGALHWRSYEDGSRSTPVIMSLNLEAEKYGKIAVPDNLRGKFDWKLRVVDGYLCIVCTFDDGTMEIWIMKEYSVLESWTKVASIPNSAILNNCASPLFVSAEGKILLRILSQDLTLLDPRNKKGVVYYSETIHCAFLFTESLVSV